jgi:hypothetical protein
MKTYFTPYFGDERIQALQRARDAQAAIHRDTAGAVVHGRTFSSDDPATLGWDRLREVMSEEGMVVLRGVDAQTLKVARRELADFTPTEHVWDLFMAEAPTLRDVCGKIVEQGLPQHLRQLPASELSAEKARSVQAFLARQGVSPFSTDALLGKLFPAALIVLEDAVQGIVATGFAAMTHNHHSPFHGIAWVGLIGVSSETRGLGLGKMVDAIANLSAVTDLGAKATMEFVAQDNEPSRAMLKSCGLHQVEDKSVVMFSTSTDRITR